MSGEDAPGRREVAYRVFAAEYEDATHSYSESDEERAPNYVVTPTGARANRLFVAGVLTEVEQVNDDVLRARVVDPTGAFVVYAGQYQPDAMAFFERADPPVFVAVTGKANTFQPDGSDRVFTSVRPESVNEVDAETRDRWTVQTAEHTLARVSAFAAALDRAERGEELEAALLAAGVEPGTAAGIPRAVDAYGTSRGYLAAVRDLALYAARVVASERDDVRGLPAEPSGGDPDATLDLDYAVGEAVTLDAGPAGSEAEAAGASDESEQVTGAGDGEASSAGASTGDGVESGNAATGGDAAAARSGADSGDESPAAGDTTVDVEANAGEGVEATGTPDDAGAPAVEEPETEAGERADAATPDSEPPADESADGEAAVGASPGSESAGGDGGAAGDGDAGPATDDEGMYELDEAEREELESEYGTEFSSGSDIPDAGEADIETPASDEAAAESADADADADGSGVEDAADAEDGAARSTTDGDEAASGSDADGGDVDLEDAVVAAMQSVGDGDGASHDEVVASVVEEHGAEPEAVEDAIQDALMSGRCYESGEDEYTAI